MSKASNLSRFVPSIEPTNNLNVGFVTATSIESTDATFNGNVSIAGTLTYEDVENVDSVGLITARNGVHVVGGGITVTGIATFHDNVKIGTATTITSDGINVTGIATATDFVGINSVTVGSAVTITSDGVNVTGIVTATDFVGINSVTVGSAVTITSDGVNVTGIVTATSFAGSGASITSIDAGNISTGIVTSGILGGGTASSTTFLNGNGQFTAPNYAWEYISKVTISIDASQIDFTSDIDDTYDHYVFLGRNIIPDQDQTQLRIRYFTSNGIQEGFVYHYATDSVYSGSVNQTTAFNETALYTSNENSAASIDNTFSYGGTNFEYHLINPSALVFHPQAYGYKFNRQGSGTAPVMNHFAHQYRYQNAITGVRFYMSSGDISSGQISLYGIKGT